METDGEMMEKIWRFFSRMEETRINQQIVFWLQPSTISRMTPAKLWIFSHDDDLGSENLQESALVSSSKSRVFGVSLTDPKNPSFEKQISLKIMKFDKALFQLAMGIHGGFQLVMEDPQFMDGW